MVADFKIPNLLPPSLSLSLRVILVVTKLFLEVHPPTPDVVEVLKNFHQILRYFHISGRTFQFYAKKNRIEFVISGMEDR